MWAAGGFDVLLALLKEEVSPREAAAAAEPAAL
jgi:hypothetical protein